MSKAKVILDDSTKDDIIKNAWKAKPMPKKAKASTPKPKKKRPAKRG
jgi:hypothetical protein